LNSIDRSNFSVEPHQLRVEKPWGYELHLTPPDAPYTMKIIHVDEGKRLSLQVHDEKTETWTVMTGRGGVLLEDAEGEMQLIELKPGSGYTSQLGQKHRLVGLEGGCDFLEASTPERGTTWRLEDDYNRLDETEEMREQPNRGWHG
jgi:mannose-6-phosphate isomerase-like protein (cupin superfamily)